MSDKIDDVQNGYLLISSPLGIALSQGTAGDELSFRIGDTERSVLFVSLERLSARAA
jgi:transcription elongation GreA/GreB family factor